MSRQSTERTLCEYGLTVCGKEKLVHILASSVSSDLSFSRLIPASTSRRHFNVNSEVAITNGLLVSIGSRLRRLTGAFQYVLLCLFGSQVVSSDDRGVLFSPSTIIVSDPLLRL